MSESDERISSGIPPFSLDSTTESLAGNPPLNPHVVAALASATTSKRGRGRPRKDGTNTSGTGPTQSQSTPRMSAELRAELSKQMEALYDSKAWGALLSMPADTALAITGKDRWKISGDERATLGACGGVAARFMAFENPKTLAFLMLGSALFSVYVPRCTAELKEMYAMKQRRVTSADIPNASNKT